MLVSKADSLTSIRRLVQACKRHEDTPFNSLGLANNMEMESSLAQNSHVGMESLSVEDEAGLEDGNAPVLEVVKHALMGSREAISTPSLLGCLRDIELQKKQVRGLRVVLAKNVQILLYTQKSRSIWRSIILHKA